MLLAKIKGNKVHFGKLVTFLGEGGGLFTPTDPLDPLEGFLGDHLLENFPRGGAAQILSLRGGGSDPLGPPYGHLCLQTLGISKQECKVGSTFTLVLMFDQVL